MNPINSSRREFKQPITHTQLGHLLEARWAYCRENFASYRKCMHPGMLWGWWTQEVSDELQAFYSDMAAGKRPKLALMAPPQIGKSSAISDFTSWVAGKNSDLNIIFASYSDDLGIRTNMELQRAMTSPTYRKIFARTEIGCQGWQCNNNLIEFGGHKGSFRNTTVMSAITGFGLNLGIIDDPVKGHQEANSKVVRDRVWNWYCDDCFTRFAVNAGQLVIMTRWHVDDLLGRALQKSPDWKVLRYPAIATEDERYRRKGEALFPEFKPLDFLEERRKLYTAASWEALYQQNPIVVGGGILPIDKMQVLPFLDKSKIRQTVRYVDKAATIEEWGKYTAMVRMHAMKDGSYIISHIARGKWTSLEREENMKRLAQADKAEFGWNYEIGVEQEPGSGGKESAEATIRNLAGFRAFADKVTGSKEVRAEPFAAQVQGGNVHLIAGNWVTAWYDEYESYPTGRYKDQVDAAAGAFNRLSLKHTTTTWTCCRHDSKSALCH
jgi:predicted phage terminase large subunit-like protein